MRAMDALHSEQISSRILALRQHLLENGEDQQIVATMSHIGSGLNPVERMREGLMGKLFSQPYT